MRAVNSLRERHQDNIDQQVRAEEDHQNLHRLEGGLDDRVDLLEDSEHVDDAIGDEEQRNGIKNTKVQEVLGYIQVMVELVPILPLQHVWQNCRERETVLDLEQEVHTLQPDDDDIKRCVAKSHECAAAAFRTLTRAGDDTRPK